MTAVYDGAARTLEGLLQIDSKMVMGLVFVVVTGYTLIGGFRAVVATDGVQGVILLCGAVTLPIAMLYRGGGIGRVLDAVQDRSPLALEFTSGLPLLGLVGTALGIALKIIVDPRLLSRFYGL
jgi:Na+/pantothenate symporter